NNQNELSLKKDKTRVKKSSLDLNNIVLGKVPPQSTDIEEAILGAIMIEKGAFDTVSDFLKPECFYADSHKSIYEAFLSLNNAGKSIDILTVVEELNKTDKLKLVGGAYYISKLTNTVVSSAHIETHARIVLQKFIQRELIRISGEIIQSAYEPSTDVFDLLDETESKIFNITNHYLKKNFEDMGTAIVKAMNKIEELRNKKEDISGITSGFKSIDNVTFGWQPTDLIILAARPSVGKTAFALNLALNAALQNNIETAVGFFSLEMSVSQLVMRVLSCVSEVPMNRLSRGKLEEYEFQQILIKGVNRLEKAQIFIDETPALNIFEFRAKARRMVNRHHVKIIIIDYLQLMSGNANNKNTNREQEISTISRNLKALAKELEVPIIALSQLSRAVETRKESNKMPQLSDLRESGAIEQDADLVMFLYRPDYYEQTQNEHGENIQGQVVLRIAKHRNGSLEDISLRARLDIQKFEDWTNVSSSSNLPPSFKPFNSKENTTSEGQIFVNIQSKMNIDDSDNFENFDDPENLYDDDENPE
ncbi:MAG: replicative DNA helicase, partial [Sediminibacterium sp.]|nr:replicative DNA helicase [Sediminibacterium sp.]